MAPDGGDDDALLAALAECFPEVPIDVLTDCVLESDCVFPDAIDAVLARLYDDSSESCNDVSLEENQCAVSQGARSVRPSLREAFWRAKRTFPDADEDAVAALVEACGDEHHTSGAVYAAVAQALRASGLDEHAASKDSVPLRLRVSRLTPAVECIPWTVVSSDNSKPTLSERLEAYFTEYDEMPDLAGDNLLERAERLRELASDTHDMRATTSQRARQAHADGGLTGRSVAGYLGARARGLHTDAASLNRAAAALIFYASYAPTRCTRADTQERRRALAYH